LAPLKFRFTVQGLLMKHAIAGVSPPELGEVTTMTVWPSISAVELGRIIGRLCGIKWPQWPHKFFTVGKLFALMLIPVGAPLYFYRVAVPLLTYCMTLGFFPVTSTCQRYRLTNRRVIIQTGLLPIDESSVTLDQFDSIKVQVQPGQQWYPAGDLVFYNGAVEVFRLNGVSRPEGFRRACLSAHTAFVSVKQATDQQAAAT